MAHERDEIEEIMARVLDPHAFDDEADEEERAVAVAAAMDFRQRLSEAGYDIVKRR